MRKLTKNQATNLSWTVDIFFLAIILACLFFIQIGTRALFSPDEGRYAEIAREMVVRHDYVTPYLNHIQYFEKPALFYWLAAASIKLGGAKVGAVRCVNALIAILGALFTYITARILFDRKTGILAALILSTNLLYFVMAHMVSLDLPITIFLASSLYAFLLASMRPQGLTKRWLMWFCAAMAACAVLTKGLIGIVFPGLIILPWLLLTGEWRKLKNYYVPTSLLLFLAIAAPWHLIVGARNPGFFHFYFIEQHLLRYTTMDVGHYQPIWYFIPCLIMGFFPWIVFLPQALASQLRDKRHLFFFLWATLIFIFFSFSKSKLIPYILPIFPAISMLTARYLANTWEQKRARALYASLAILTMFSIAIAAVFYWFINTTAVTDAHTATCLLSLASAILILGAITAMLTRRDAGKAITAILTAAYLFLVLIHAALPAIDTRTVQPLAAAIKPMLSPQDEVITYNRYYQELPFYLERRITILNWQNEMSYGMQRQDTSEWMINDSTFWKRWNSKQRVFVFIGKDELQKWKDIHPSPKFYLVAETLTNAVISNQAVQ